MNHIEELKIYVEALFYSVKGDDFFKPIYKIIERLHALLTDQTQNATQVNIEALSFKIDAFFQQYRPSGDVPYVPPKQASSNDSNVKHIHVLAKDLLDYPNDEFNAMISSSITETNSTKNIKNKSIDKIKVFIVHGHDDLAKTEVSRFIEKLDFEAIILHEQASSGKTIIEKIEEYSNVGFGIVLYTSCDIGAKNSDNSDNPDLHPRARQNVVFEHGYLIGKLGRSSVCALVKGAIEKPNDISGVVYINMDEAGAWQTSLAKELKEAGYNVDMNKLIS